MKAAARLKRPQGWFVAGDGFRRALGLRSAGAFRRFAWICLHADRASGELDCDREGRARSPGKSRSAVGRHLAELTARGVCEVEPAPSQHRASRVRATPAYWPCAAGAADAGPDGGTAACVASVRRLYAQPSCVQGAFTVADERLAAERHRAGIPLETVRRALLLGSARKSFALIDRPEGQPIGSLRNFQPVLEAVRWQARPSTPAGAKLDRNASSWRR